MPKKKKNAQKRSSIIQTMSQLAYLQVGTGSVRLYNDGVRVYILSLKAGRSVPLKPPFGYMPATTGEYLQGVNEGRGETDKVEP